MSWKLNKPKFDYKDTPTLDGYVSWKELHLKYNTSISKKQILSIAPNEGNRSAGEQRSSANGVLLTDGDIHGLNTGGVSVSIPVGKIHAPKLALAIVTEHGTISGNGSEYTLLDTVQTSVLDCLPNGFKQRKIATNALADRITKYNAKLAKRMYSCGATFTVDVTTCPHQHTSELHRIDKRCAHRLCPQCARIRGIRMGLALSEPLKQWQTANGLYAYHVGLTLKDTEHLPSMKSMNTWKKKLLKGEFFSKYGYFGALAVMEIKAGKRSRLFHPHFHVIVFTTKPIPTYQVEGANRDKNLFCLTQNKELSAEWNEINGGAGYIVQGEAFDGNYAEMFKYLCKDVNNLNNAQLKELVEWMHGKRFLSMTGKLYSNKELKTLMAQADKANDDGDDDGNELDDEQIACPHCGCMDTVRRVIVWDDKVNDYRWKDEPTVVVPFVMLN